MMSITSSELMRWKRFSISLGTIAWALLTAASLLGWIELNALELTLLLALLVIAPLAVPLALQALPLQHDWLRTWQRLTVIVQPIASLIGGISFLLHTGPLAAVAAAVWVLFTGFIAVQAVVRLRQVGRVCLITICPAVALIYLPIGGTWLVFARLGLQPLGFPPDIVLLTAVHFHFITLAALVMTGLIGQAGSVTKPAFPWRLYRITAIGMVVEPPMVAAGYTLAQFTGSQYLESAASTLLALSLILVSLLSLRFVIPSTISTVARGLLLVSSTAVLFTMLAVGAYAIGNATGAWTITIAQMIAIHGWINALVFGLCGLLGWRLRIGQWEA
jgi:YndJ-like protein